MPAEPRPAIVLPMINMTEDWAAPQMTEPISKIAKKTSHAACIRGVSISETPKVWKMPSVDLGIEEGVDLASQGLECCSERR